jgi:molybdenum cofactor biosynthesis enzyme MoaA
MVQHAEPRRLPDRFPLTCQWELTCRCNLRCLMCYTDCFNRPEPIRRELGTQDILRIMDELAEAGTLDLCLTGGEPLVRPDFFEIYEHAVRRGFLVTVFTNGTLITEAEADRFAAWPPQRIEISWHGSTRETFERVTQGRGSYDRCLAAVRVLLERRIPLVLKTTALTVNRHDILAIKAFAASLGPVGFKLGEEIRPALDGGAGPFRYALSEPELTTLHRQDPVLSAEASRRNGRAEPPCVSGKHRFHVDAYGCLQLCSGNRRGGYDLRKGSFSEGFYRHLPTFECRWKRESAPLAAPPVTSHA